MYTNSILTRHLINNGVRESPPNPSSIFADIRGNNVGLKFWHPTSVIPSGGTPLGRAATGGAWEWTSTILERHEGFKEDEMYPEYTGKYIWTEQSLITQDEAKNHLCSGFL
jgi:hypothetical protein